VPGRGCWPASSSGRPIGCRPGRVICRPPERFTRAWPGDERHDAPSAHNGGVLSTVIRPTP
jgi:hypothetical protein